MLYASQQLGVYVNNFVDRLNYQSGPLSPDSKQIILFDHHHSPFMNADTKEPF